MLNNASLHLDRIRVESAIDHRYVETINAAIYRESHSYIQHQLRQKGLSFEGREMFVSLRPTVLLDAEILKVSTELALVRTCINRIISKTIEEIKSTRSGILKQFFSFYKPWFPLMANEARHNDPIMLMRYDSARDADGQLRMMEPNGSGPGGIIGCSIVRNAWLGSPIGKRVLGDLTPKNFLIDRPDSFLRFVQSVSQRSPHANIAVCNYKGLYAYEHETLRTHFEQLRAADLISGQFVVGDIREIEIRGNDVFINGVRIDVLYSRLGQLMIDPSDPDFEGWIKASQLDSCEFLNSIAAIFLGDAKSIFAALYDPQIQDAVGFSEAEIQAITKYVLPTYKIVNGNQTFDVQDLLHNRHRYVLKADASTRGRGICVGRATDPMEWGGVMLRMMVDNSLVIQLAVELPQTITFHARDDGTDHEMNALREYYGVDHFFFGSSFAGAVSRCHSSMVFNLGNGGREVPTLVLNARGGMAC